MNERAKAVRAAEAKMKQEIETERLQLKEDEARMEQERKLLQDEVTEFEQQKKAMEALYMIQSSPVKLDVGGHKFKTSVATLTSQPNSMLAVMFSGRHELKTDEDGAHFFDREYSFQPYSEFLEKSKGFQGNFARLLDLLKEADYYLLTQLVMHIKRILMPVIAEETIYHYYLQTRPERPFVTDKPVQPRQEDVFPFQWQDRGTVLRRTLRSFSFEECNLPGLDLSETAFIHIGF